MKKITTLLLLASNIIACLLLTNITYAADLDKRADKILIVLIRHTERGNTSKKTEFIEAGHRVDVASIEGYTHPPYR